MSELVAAAPYWAPALSLLGVLWSFRSSHHRPEPVTKEEMKAIADGIDLQPLAVEVAKAMQDRQHATITKSYYENVRFHLTGRLETW